MAVLCSYLKNKIAYENKKSINNQKKLNATVDIQWNEKHNI